MNFKKRGNDLAGGNLRRVIHDAHSLEMPGSAGTHLLVSWMISMPAHEADGSGHNPRCFPENLFDSPVAASSEIDQLLALSRFHIQRSSQDNVTVRIIMHIDGVVELKHCGSLSLGADIVSLPYANAHPLPLNCAESMNVT